MTYEEIEKKHSKIIKIAKNHMKSILDPEHDINHMNDVVKYTKELLDNLDDSINKEVCIICAYWHDVGRIYQNNGHEKISSTMLKEIMQKYNYDDKIINDCYTAIENHRWDMTPENKEGLVIKDADKLAWLGRGRWDSCLKNKKRLESIISLLPKLKSDILYFDISKRIYDREIIKLVSLLYDYI